MYRDTVSVPRRYIMPHVISAAMNAETMALRRSFLFTGAARYSTLLWLLYFTPIDVTIIKIMGHTSMNIKINLIITPPITMRVAYHIAAPIISNLIIWILIVLCVAAIFCD